MQRLLEGPPCLRHAFTIPMIFLVTISSLSVLPLCISHALDADSIIQEDHNHPRILDLRSKVYGLLGSHDQHGLESYEPDFVGLDRSIIGRAPEIEQLKNNVPGTGKINAGDSQFYMFSKSELKTRQVVQSLDATSSQADLGMEAASFDIDRSLNERDLGLEGRQTGRTTLYVTLNICDQPLPTSPNPNGAPPPLQLYISRSPKPDASKHDIAVPVFGGLGVNNVTATSDIYFGIVAPQSPNFKGSYSYELTASTDEPYTSYIDFPGMLLVDSDANSALLSSDNITVTPHFTVFVHNQINPTIWGLQNSFCGLRKHAQIKGQYNDSANGDVDTGMMSLAPERLQQLFYVKSLNGSSQYYGVKAIIGNNDTKSGPGIPGGGGSVFKTMDFSTKSDNNCAVIFNLSFCTNVAYAVPYNPFNVTSANKTAQTDLSALTRLYDDYARNLYQNFSKSLQQIPCDTTSSAQYSLARTCDDCDKAYRTWLCAVTIPRCEDFTNDATYLQARAVGQDYPNGSAATNLSDPAFSPGNKTYRAFNQSRNPMIDERIRPGPYKEILPCADLCYDLVRSCPATLGFACPLKGHGLNHSYGYNATDELTCNYPGAVFGGRGAAAGLLVNIWIVATALLVGLVVSL